MTQNKEMGKAKSPKLLYRRGIILLVSIIGVGLLYYLVPGKLKKPIPPKPKILLIVLFILFYLQYCSMYLVAFFSPIRTLLSQS